MKKTLYVNSISLAFALIVLGLAVLGCSSMRGTDSRPDNAAKTTKDDSSLPAETIDAADLLRQYQTDKFALENKLKGKTVAVRGWAFTSPTMPTDDSVPGILGLQEKGKVTPEIQCRFNKSDSDQFSNIKGDQYVTVKGTFGSDLFPELRPCQLVKIE